MVEVKQIDKIGMFPPAPKTGKIRHKSATASHQVTIASSPVSRSLRVNVAFQQKGTIY